MIETTDVLPTMSSSSGYREAHLARTVADAVWIATATLHKEQSSDGPFTSNDIFQKVRQLALTDRTDETIKAHIAKHCVANTNPDPNRIRMLYAPARAVRRLFRPGDPYHLEREGTPIHPDWSNLPTGHTDLKDWYEQSWILSGPVTITDPLLAAAGLGTGMWDGLDADTYVSSLREGWENRP